MRKTPEALAILNPDLPDVTAAVDAACARIAPTWPLDRFIAVNPFWGFTDAPVTQVCARLKALSGSRLLMPRSWYLEQWRTGKLRAEHLSEAARLAGSRRSAGELVSSLAREVPQPPRRARVVDVVDEQRDLVHHVSWRDFVTNSISQHCAAYFDEGQAQLGPDRTRGLYSAWIDHAPHDRSPVLLMGLRGFGQLVSDLPASPRELIPAALDALDVVKSEREPYLTGLLLDVNGWAAWCAYRRWTARLEGGDDRRIVELLAIRLAWEWVLHRAGDRGIAARWQMAMASWPATDLEAERAQEDDWVFQRAVELAYQRPLCGLLTSGLRASRPTAPAVQAVFCIDVRSEVFRRALETQSSGVQTLGFAGFFGLPAEYQPVGAPAARPQLPGLLAPRLRVTDTAVPGRVAERRSNRLDLASAWKQFKTHGVSGFSFVESMGLLYAGKLWGDAFGYSRAAADPERTGLTDREHALRKPRLTASSTGEPLDVAARCDLADGILRAMSLTREFARLVALLGHGSATVNNPHAAGLDCGACCGQTGEANARAVAALLNDAAVREGLSARGLDVPSTTHFVAGLHNTTTDQVELFDLDELPPTHAEDVATLRGWLESAGDRAREERARKLELEGLNGESLRKAVIARSRDWSQVRAEWGLANNAAFIVAPREHCRHLDLDGRSFLHEYRWEEDPQFAILELIVTAPMIVTHWINFQYYASTVDNVRYGSGNKVLHNVVGGHLGVFEGNGGDLRLGLPLQSLHDGHHWMHTPLRLSVFIEAPRAAIEGVVRKHAKVRELVENEWIHLFQIDATEEVVHQYGRGTWVPQPANPCGCAL